ncbi:MAG: MBL fold metallo-hydrolase [Leptospiraceae bacterium]|nr:MBL fold metallo-hydrolase [Leptospiraceae bacterium]
MKLFFILTFFIFNINCSSPNSPEGKPHHYGEGFRNLDTNVPTRGFGDVLMWRAGNLFKKLPSLNPDDYKFTQIDNDGKKLRENSTEFSVTWIGHASTLVQLDGINILTDPIWSERCSPVNFAGPKRYTKPGLKLEALPKIDIVIISHNHYDHMDLPSLKELDKLFSPTFFVGLKNKEFLESEGLKNVVELDWWDSKKIENIKVTFTPTQHASGRGIFDQRKTLWGSYVIEGKEKSFYFAGDTAYFSGFKKIGEKFPNLDFAILPIGAYEPRWFMKVVHMNPADSVQAFIDLGAKKLVPVHYQTFVLTDEALDEPLKNTIKEFEDKSINRESLIDLKIGESRTFK